MSALKYWIWLAARNGIGCGRARQLIEHFGTPEAVYRARYSDYTDVDGIRPAHIKELMLKELDIAGDILSSCSQIGCRIITLQDSEYPDRLRNIYDPPLLLYVRGTMPNIDDHPVIGVVGTRKCTPYGIKTAENVCYDLSRRGVITVTGLARGVDTAAARGALRGGSPTIGVIGSGLDVVYPPENRAVYDDVAGFGAVISEYPPGTPPVQYHFPARNRIISGLSLGVAVIEAPKKSGALITAARALEQGRDVFALPGNVDAATCVGSNALLREGAIPFTSADDIIDEYIELYPHILDVTKDADHKKSIDNSLKVDYIDKVIPGGELPFDLDGLDGDEKCVAQSIAQESLHIDEIMVSTGLSAQKVLTTLTMLELGGYVHRDINGKWEIKFQSLQTKL